MLALVAFSSGVCLAAPHSFTTHSTQADGELKSTGSSFGNYDQGDKDTTRGAIGGGYRGYEYVVNSAKNAPGKKGALGAVDGAPDAGNSSKGNTFTTTVLKDTARVGQTFSGNYQIYKAFLSFDTSAIPNDALVDSVDLIFYGKSASTTGSADFSVQVFKSVYTEPLWNPDWGAITGSYRGELSVADFKVRTSEVDPNSGRNVISITAGNVPYLITLGGTTKIALVSSRTYSQTSPTGDEYVEIYSANAEQKALRPSLQINYTGSDLDVSPALSWTAGDAEFKDAGASPSQIYVGTTPVTFRVRYTYDDGAGGTGTAPVTAKLLLDLDNDNQYTSPGEEIAMQEVNPADTDYSDGKDYIVEKEITSNGVDNIGYQFLFTANGKEAEGTPTRKSLINSIQASEDSSDSKFCFISSIVPW
jgi:hypothetical protein